MAHEHDVQDSDKRFVIDPATRNIKNESGKIVLIQGDHNSERFTFEIPRYVDGHDMAKCNTVKIHYLNAAEPGVYEAGDLRVDPSNSESVIFTWLVSGNATLHDGPLNFAIKFACVTNGVTEYAWGTGVYSGLTIGMSIDNSETIVQEYADILEQWKSEILADLDTRIEEAIDARVGTTIDAANEAAVSAQTQAALAAEAAISAKAYTNVLKSEQSGEVVHIEDAFPADILETTVYGKSEQIATTGKNLMRQHEVLTNTKNGVTVTYRNDTFNIVGTSTFDNVFSIDYFGVAEDLTKHLEIGKSYTFSMADFTGSGDSLYAQINYTNSSGDEKLMSYISLPSTLDVFTVPDDYVSVKSIFVGVKYSNPPVPMDCSFRLQVEEGNVATEWEPYTDGFASPSPDWPQDISSVTSVELVMTGRNLIGTDVYTFNDGETKDGLTLTVNDDNTITIKGTKTTDNTWTAFYSNTLSNPVMYPPGVYHTPAPDYNNGYTGLTMQTCTEDGVNLNASGTIEMDKRWNAVRAYVGFYNAVAIDMTIPILMEYQNPIGDNIPYQGYRTIIDLAGNELRSLTDGTRDELVIAADGSYGVLRYTGEITLDGVVGNGVTSYGVTDDYRVTTILAEPAAASDQTGYSTGGVFNASWVFDGTAHFTVSSRGALFFYVAEQDTSLVDGAAYFADNPMTVVYKLAEPKYVPIGTLDTPLALPENTSNVWVTTNLGTTVKVKYVQDINIVINNLIGGIQNG